MTQAALNYCLGPAPNCMGKAVMEDEAAFAYTFGAPDYLGEKGEGPHCVTVLWAPYQSAKLPRLAEARYLDICGETVDADSITVGEEPVYILTSGIEPGALFDQLKAQLHVAGVL